MQGEIYEFSPWETEIMSSKRESTRLPSSNKLIKIKSDQRLSFDVRNQSRKSTIPPERQSVRDGERDMDGRRDKLKDKLRDKPRDKHKIDPPLDLQRNRSEHYFRYCTKRAQRSIQLYLQKIKKKIKRQKIEECMGREGAGIWRLQRKELLHKMKKVHPPANFVYFNRNFL